ncbi:MAG: hypothetical protein ACLPYY_01055 [Acidimicrobiales bacterium]
MTTAYLDALLGDVVARYPGEPEFLQAVSEVVQCIGPVLEQHPEYRQARIVERLVEPERRAAIPWPESVASCRAAATGRCTPPPS